MTTDQRRDAERQFRENVAARRRASEEEEAARARQSIGRVLDFIVRAGRGEVIADLLLQPEVLSVLRGLLPDLSSVTEDPMEQEAIAETERILADRDRDRGVQATGERRATVVRPGDATAADRAGALLEEQQGAALSEDGQLSGADIDAAVDIVEFTQPEIQRALRGLSFIQADQLPPGMQEWLQTDEAAEWVVRNGDAAALDNPSEMVAQLFTSGGLQEGFDIFIKEEVPRIVQDITSGRQTSMNDRRLLAAAFDARYAEQLAAQAGNLDPDVLRWLQSDEGRANVLGRYLDTVRSAQSLDQTAEIAPDLIVSSLGEDAFTEVWADANPDEALARFIDTQLAGLPADLQEFVGNNLFAQMQSEFERNRRQPGGTRSFAQFLQQNAGRVSAEVNSAIERARVEQGGALSPGGALISPEFFNQTFEELFQQATGNLRTDLGREPTFAEVQEEVARIQDEQIEAVDFTERLNQLDPRQLESNRVALRESLGREPTLREVLGSIGFSSGTFGGPMFGGSSGGAFGGSPTRGFQQAQPMQEAARDITQARPRRRAFGSPFLVSRR